MKKIMWVISCISLIGTVIMIRILPESIPMHYDLSGNIDRWGSKYESLLFPAVILAITLVLTFSVRHFEKKALSVSEDKDRAGAETNARVLGIAGVLITAVFTVLQGFILYSSYKGAASGGAEQIFSIGKIPAILTGILLVVLGNIMTKTRINRFVGVRISWSMYNDNTWRKSNRFGAVALITAGILTIILAVFIKSSSVVLIAAIGLVVLAAVITVVNAHRVYAQEIRTEKGE